MKFRKRSEELNDYLINTRRMLHMNPETALQEEQTSNFIAEELEKIGIEVIRLEKHAVIGKIVGNPNGKRLAFRADMDALPMEEENKELSYCSQVPGKMHSCGHDGHMAMLLGAAKLFKEDENDINGTIYLCFQGAEEIGDGVDVIIDYLKSEGGVDNIIATHLWAEIDSGDISIVEGPRMASGGGWTVDITGRGGHGSRPDLTIDPIRPAAEIALAVTSIPTNFYTPLDPMVINCGVIKSGTVRNIVPTTARVHGGYRVFTKEAREAMIKHINQMSVNIARAYGAEAEVTIDNGIPPVYNDPDAVKMGRKVVEDLETFSLIEFEQICASENFGMLLEQWPGFLAFVGIRNEEKGIVYGQHHPKFNIDEEVMHKVVEFYLSYAEEFFLN